MPVGDGLVARRVKMVVELAPKCADKGLAVARLMAAPPFAGALPLFIGDDTTDEDGFAAVAAAGGHGILVGAPRPTARSEEHTSELQSLMRISYAVFCLKKKNRKNEHT